MNNLTNSKSAYLRQHEDNPVHWEVYSTEVIKKAEQENKPIFLSIGYSSCHWCHVMAHESFEDEKTAEFLNQNFVNIKIDREEHPDLDQLYQKSAHFFGKNGGWPLSVFLTPEMKPFFVGTYFPKDRRGQMPSFMDVLHELDRAYRSDQDLIKQNSENAYEYLKKPYLDDKKVEFQGHFPHPNSVLDALKDHRDVTYGGFKGSPKFPTFAFWEWASEQMQEGLITKEHGEFVIKTIDNILLRGLFDQARGGLHRYSTDEKWSVPHFEKMLYDQAGLLKVLAKISNVYPAPHVFDGILSTLEYIKLEMQSEKGYFFAAQDADSEGVEGLYFTFTYDELKELISKNEKLDEAQDQILSWLDAYEEGNFEQGLNVIQFHTDKKQEYLSEDHWELIRILKNEIVNERKTRIPPMTDNKGIASWNFLFCSSLVDVIQYCRVPVIKQMARDLLESALKGIHDHFIIKDKNSFRINHVTTLENTPLYFEDYATYTDLQLRLFEWSGDTVFKKNFENSFKFIFKEFYKNGEFHCRSINSDQEKHLNIPYEKMDLSFRSCSSMMLELTRRYHLLTGDDQYLKSIEDSMEEFKHFILKNPLNFAQGMRAVCYPENSYRVLKVPRKWAGTPEFVNLWSFLTSRFVMNFEEERNEEETWQICSSTACELDGKNLPSILEAMQRKPSQAQS